MLLPCHYHQQEDAQELADPIRLAKLIKQYSQFIQFPIKLYSSRKEAKQVVDEAATAKRQEEADKIAKDKEEEPIKVGWSGDYVVRACWLLPAGLLAGLVSACWLAGRLAGWCCL